MNESLWAQSLEVSWRPRPSYLERRTRFASRVEDEGLPVRAFRAEADEMGIRLGDAFDELTISASGFRYDNANRNFDEGVAVQAIGVLTDSIAPEQANVRSVAFQHLSPIERRTYDEARQTAVRAFLGGWTHQSDLVDFALMVDGHFPSLGDYQVEFGIVQESEIEHRLTRALGRSPEPHRRLPPGWDDLGLPEVALFLDISWSSLGSGLQTANMADRIVDLWRSRRQASWELIRLLEKSYVAADT